MHRLIYISTARHILSPADLDGILLASRRNNAAVGVTGLLVVGGRRFLQALEGPDHAVAATFRRIGQDSRHFAVVTLAHRPIEARAFPDWSMGYQRGGTDAEQGRSLRTIVDRLVAPLDDPTIRAYFTQFAMLHAAA